MSDQYILAIDQGTTSSRSHIFDQKFQNIGSNQHDINCCYSNDGWVEQDPEELFESTLKTIRAVIQKTDIDPKKILGAGITNQRETTILWDKNTGKAVYPAIVWQDRRTADYCASIGDAATNHMVQQKTGLRIDPYFSATKIRWILDNVENARTLASRNQLLFGTVETYLIWKLSSGKTHVTDITNASRTALCNIRTQAWDEELLKLFEIPPEILPSIKPNTCVFSHIDKSIAGVNIPVTGCAGDQQAASIGQACLTPGSVKATFGTGCFVLLNTGKQVVNSTNGLLSTIAYTIQNQTSYALEGSIFNAGSTIKWLRDKLKIIDNASQTAAMAAKADISGVYMVPAFTGLGAPHWDPKARAALFGLTASCGVNEIVKAALEGVIYQTRDLFVALSKDCQAVSIQEIKVDGGMALNDYAMQFLADITGVRVIRPYNIETTVAGCAYLAGLTQGIYPPPEEISGLYPAKTCFNPSMETSKVSDLCTGWAEAVSRTKTTKTKSQKSNKTALF